MARESADQRRARYVREAMAEAERRPGRLIDVDGFGGNLQVRARRRGCWRLVLVALVLGYVLALGTADFPQAPAAACRIGNHN